MAKPNISVERFKKLTEQMQKEIHEHAVVQLNIEATDLARVIQNVAPIGETGNLEHSVRVIPGNKDTIVRVVAGGRKTIRPSISSKPYDYARADEFGTRNVPAQPFFFPTYRLLRKKMRSRMKRRIVADIKKHSAA